MAEKKRILVCPKCGFRFDVSYARAFACGGCPSVVSCAYVKCLKCGYEFPIRRPLMGTKLPGFSIDEAGNIKP
jgi:hypothetical protein